MAWCQAGVAHKEVREVKKEGRQAKRLCEEQEKMVPGRVTVPPSYDTLIQEGLIGSPRQN